jgi:rod shape-determining protein MreC
MSLALLFADTRYRYLENIRQAVAIVLYPLQRAVQLPGEALAQVGAYFASQRGLASDVAALRQELLRQAPTVQSYPMLEQENARLRALLQMQNRFHGAVTAAEVMYSGRDPFSQKIFIDKGESRGVQPGQAVIDEFGVVGQVTRSFVYMAEVTLVTDKDHAVPVRVERSGVRSVLYGAGSGRAPELRFMSPNADIQTGDRLLTSGIDGTYPPGLAVAQVVSVERETGQRFAHIACRPLAGVEHSSHVLVLAHSAIAPRPDEPAEADAPRKGRGRRKN